MKRYLLITIFLVSLIACKKSVSDSVVTISIDKPADEFVELSRFVSSVDYVPLETNSYCLINKIRNIKFWGDSILIFNEISWNMTEILVFNKSGKYLGTFGQYGPGPEEIKDPRDILRAGDSVLLWDRDYMVEFDKKGNFKRSLFKAFLPGRNFFVDSGNIFLYHGSVFPGLLSQYDKNGGLKELFKPIEPQKASSQMEGESVALVKGEYHLFAPALDTVWTLNSNKILPAYVVTFKEGMSLQSFFQKYSDEVFPGILNFMNSTPLSHVLRFLEDDDYLFLTWVSLKKQGNTIISKRNKHQIDFVYCDNDIDDGLFGSPVTVFDNNLIIPIEPAKILNHLKKKTSNTVTKFDEMGKKIKEDDNPVLMFCKLKF